MKEITVTVRPEDSNRSAAFQEGVMAVVMAHQVISKEVLVKKIQGWPGWEEYPHRKIGRMIDNMVQRCKLTYRDEGKSLAMAPEPRTNREKAAAKIEEILRPFRKRARESILLEVERRLEQPADST